MCQMLSRGGGKFFSAECMVCYSRADQRWGFASMREVAEMDESVLGHVLRDTRLCTGGCLLGKTRVQRQLGAGVAEEEMLHDLLDSPLVGTRGRLELGLASIESVEAESYLALKTMKGGVHKQDHVTPLAGATASVLCGSFAAVWM